MTAFLFWLCVVVILYVYALYPLILWAAARLFHAKIAGQPDANTPPPAVTMLISAYQEEAVIQKKLENSLALDYPSEQLQILVAVDGQEDHTKEIVETFSSQGVELSFDPQRVGKINAIQRAMQSARGEVIVLTDANTFFAPDAMRLLTAPFLDPKVGAVSGAKVIAGEDDSLAKSEGLYWKYESFIKKQETRLGSCTGVSGEIFAFRRNLFEQPPAEIINDDFYLAMRILRKGFRVVYEPHARTYEKGSLSIKDEANRRARIVAGRYQALWMGPRLLPLKYPVIVWQVVSHKFLRPLIPFAMLGAFLANLAAVLWPPQSVPTPWLQLAAPYSGLFLGGQILFYLLAWLGNRLQPRFDLPGLGKTLYLPAFLVNSNLAAISGLVLYLSGRQTNLWQRVARR
jgi:poly-beta-1,6-N-acetyl-D-glucosamine synthase